jgi:hypothetical protein
MKLQELKAKTPAELVSFAEELEVENASTMRKQDAFTQRANSPCTAESTSTTTSFACSHP